MKNSNVIPVILAGGTGSRLWPASRSLFPKQFINLVDTSKSLFQQTLDRLMHAEDLANPIVVCNDEHRFLVAEQLRENNVKADAILLEPVGKNTAPAVALAALQAISNNEDASILVLPADHIIKNQAAFNKAINQASILVDQNKLVTFGIKTTRAETGYGYIQKGNVIDDTAGYGIISFVEKPNQDLASKYFKSNDYLWNSGMFLFKAKVYLSELKKLSPNIYEVCANAHKELSTDLDFDRISNEIFSSCEEDSIDYAVMEKTDAAAVIPLDADWSDIGAWHSLSEVLDIDQNGNTLIGDVIVEDTKNTLIRAESRHVSTLGLKNHVVIETADAVLVADKNNTAEVKKIVERLKANGRSETSSHKRVYRPWGWYESICSSDNFQVKQILVNPGASLSLQMHHHRAEHWVVVKGKAKVTNGESVKTFTEDQSTYIPIGNKHRLENEESEPLIIIEVQSGSYLGEDDIVRFEDNYGR